MDLCTIPRMLAYVFWHRPAPDVPSGEYIAFLARFHQQLKDNPTAGFRGSASFQTSAAPWLPGEGIAFEDWYLLDGSAGLDPLNEGAIAAPRLDAHDRVARLAASGAGGLYRLRRGEADFSRAAHAHWFQKPAGMRYDELFDLLAPLTETRGAALWCRQMVLGPAHEFCLHSSEEFDLPSPLAPARLRLRRVFPSP